MTLMIIQAFLSLYFLFLQPSSSIFVTALNLSYIIHSSSTSTSPSPSDEKNSDDFTSGLSFPNDRYPPRPSGFTEDVLRTIAAKQKWDYEDIRVSKLQNTRFARFQNYKFQVRTGKTDLAIKFSEKLDSWTRLDGDGDFKHLISKVSSATELTPFEVEGPVELIAGEGDRLSLRLPKNATFSSLKRILVGNGVKVRILKAHEISLLHGWCGGSANASSKGKKAAIYFWPLEHPYCTWFLPVHISGPVLVIAYHLSNTPIEANFLSEEIIELKPAKCYNNHMHKRVTCPITSLSSRITMMEKLLKRLLSSNVVSQNSRYNNTSTSLKAKVKATTVVQFRLELRREIRNGGYGQKDKKIEEWRTQPSVEHAWFDVTARVYGEGERLQPIQVKSVEPFIAVDSASWSNVLLNVSFTKFPIRLVPSRPLTLGVKW